MYGSQANGVAERWMNLIENGDTRCWRIDTCRLSINQKVFGLSSRKNQPDFGQLIQTRTLRKNQLQDRGKVAITMGI